MFQRPPSSFDWIPESLNLNPSLLGVMILLLLAALVNRFIRYNRRSRYRSRKTQDRYPRPVKETSGSSESSNGYVDISDPKMQLEAISRTAFEKTRLMNASEYQVFKLIEDFLRNTHASYRVMAQTSLGEVIRPKSNDKKAWKLSFGSINSKRLDFAIFNEFGLLIVALEYQGSGHYHNTSFMRDAVKKEALRKAGVELIEVPEKYDDEELRRKIAAALKP